MFIRKIVKTKKKREPLRSHGSNINHFWGWERDPHPWWWSLELPWVPMLEQPSSELELRHTTSNWLQLSYIELKSIFPAFLVDHPNPLVFVECLGWNCFAFPYLGSWFPTTSPWDHASSGRLPLPLSVLCVVLRYFLG